MLMIVAVGIVVRIHIACHFFGDRVGPAFGDRGLYGLDCAANEARILSLIEDG